MLKIKDKTGLFSGLDDEEQIWMSHGDLVKKNPSGFVSIGSTDTCENAAIANLEKNIYGVQFHPEVVHTLKGNKILQNFVFNICKAKKILISRMFLGKSLKISSKKLGMILLFLVFLEE